MEQARRYNVTPTSRMPILDRDGARLAAFGARGPKGLICNARSDQLDTYWRRYMDRRCLVPANGYFEWTKDKQPHYFTHRELPVLCFAGIDVGGGFLVVTTPPNADAALVHDRMPAVLEPDAAAAWLEADSKDALGIPQPLLAGRLESRPVNRAVNSVKNEGAELLEPLPPVEPVLFP